MPVNSRTDHRPTQPQERSDPRHRPDVDQEDTPQNRGEDLRSPDSPDRGVPAPARRARTRKAKGKI